MCFLPFLHFFAALIYLYLSVFAVIKNPKGALNKSYAVFCFSFGLWSFSQIFIQNSNVTINTVRLAENISAIGWCSFASFYLWFIVVLTKKDVIMKSNFFRCGIFILPILFIYADYAGFLKIYFIKQPWGWSFIWAKTIWHYLFYLYYGSFVGIGIYLTVDFSKKAKEPIERKQAKIIYITSIISFILGTIADVLIPELKINLIPRLGNIVVLVMSFGVVYAITKYKFLVITPGIAAEKIISIMTDALILLDPNGNVINANNAALNMVEYKKEELEGKSIAIVFADEKCNKYLIDKIIGGASIVNSECLFNKKNGVNISALFSTSAIRDEAGGIAGIVFIANDITEHKKSEEEIRKFKIISDNANYGMVIVDLSGNLLYLNKYFASIHGYEPNELIGKNLSIFHNDEQLKKVIDVNEKLKSEGSYNAMEIGHKHKNDSVFPMLMNGVLIKDEKEMPLFMAATAIDLTGYKKTQKQLNEIQEKMSRSEKLAALGKLAGMVSHELRNPLSVIRTSVYFLKMKLDKSADEKIKRQLDILDEEVNISDKIISDFLSFSRVKEPQLDSRYIYDSIKEAVQESNIPKNIELILAIEDKLPLIKADGFQIKIALYNIILNAVQAMRNGGKITLTAILKDEFLEITIEDTGEGILDINLENLFDPLFSTKANGTGLGLAVCQTIIEGHRGSIKLESEIGKGTKVTIKLPIKGEQD